MFKCTKAQNKTEQIHDSRMQMTVNEIHVIKYIKLKAKNIYLVVLITLRCMHINTYRRKPSFIRQIDSKRFQSQIHLAR